MAYRDFMMLSEYLNTVYRGCFTPAEVVANARTYYAEFRSGRRSEILKSIVDMVQDDMEYLPAPVREVVCILQEVV